MTIRGTSSQTVNTSTITITWPSGTLTGDAVFIFISAQNTITSPSGWTVVFNSGAASFWQNGAVFMKVMTSGDISTGSVVITTTGTGGIVAAAVSYVGAKVGVEEKPNNWNNASTASVSTTTSNYVGTSDQGLIWGSARLSASPTGSVGSLAQAVNNTSSAAGALYTYSPPGGSFTATFSYSGYNPSGYFQIIVIVKDLTSVIEGQAEFNDYLPMRESDLYWLFTETHQVDLGTAPQSVSADTEEMVGSKVPPVGDADLFYLHVEAFSGDFNLPTTGPTTAVPSPATGSGSSLRRMPARQLVQSLPGSLVRPRILR